MAFLVVGAVTIPVAPNGWQEQEPFVVGDMVPAFDGTLRDSRQDTKRRWRFTTRPLSSAEYTSVRGALEGATPLSTSGDAIGTVNVAARIIGTGAVQVSGGFRRTIEAELWEV